MSTFTIVNNNTETNPIFGRISTFTFPAMPYKALLDLAAKFGFASTVPETSLNAAVYRAVELEAACYKSGHYRRFARKLKDNVTELIQEVLIPAEDGQVKGERSTVARFIVTSGSYTIKPENGLGAAWLEEEGKGQTFDARVQHELGSVPAGAVGQWADDVVLNDIGGLALNNRGHSFHVKSAYANTFDAFIKAMVELSGKGNKALVFVAKTVDNSEETLSSLIASFRATIEQAIEDATEKAAKATTKRGVEGASNKLLAQKAKLAKYADLFGAEADALRSDIDKASDAIMATEIIKEFGGLKS